MLFVSFRMMRWGRLRAHEAVGRRILHLAAEEEERECEGMGVEEEGEQGT